MGGIVVGGLIFKGEDFRAQILDFFIFLQSDQIVGFDLGFL